MKTVTIPSNLDPYKIDINGQHYEYKGGDTVSVPDEVADLINNNLANEPKENEYAPVEKQISDILVALNRKLNKSGDIMTGTLKMNNNRIDNLANPSFNSSAANKAYVDSKLVVDTETEIP